MTQEERYHPSGPLALAVGLAAIAGSVDAHVFLHVTPVFVANMSGNLIRIGMLVGQGRWSPAALTISAVAAFMVGVVFATLIHDRRIRAGRPVAPAMLLIIEAVLVVAMPLLIFGLDIRFTATERLADYPIIAIGALAMGIQTVALRRVGAVAIATTYGTGTLVRISEKVVLAARGADRDGVERRRVTIVVLSAIIVSYVVGAALASAAGSAPAWLFVPAATLVLAAYFAWRGQEAATGRGATGTVEPHR